MTSKDMGYYVASYVAEFIYYILQMHLSSKTVGLLNETLFLSWYNK